LASNKKMPSDPSRSWRKCHRGGRNSCRCNSGHPYLCPSDRCVYGPLRHPPPSTTTQRHFHALGEKICPVLVQDV
jgi:hypothetical protein